MHRLTQPALLCVRGLLNKLEQHAPACDVQGNKKIIEVLSYTHSVYIFLRHFAQAPYSLDI